MWLQALTQDHLDLTLNASRAVRTRIVDRPGAWMDAAQLQGLVEDVRKVASATLPAGALKYGVLGGDPERLKASVLTILYDRQTNAPIAFNALAWMPTRLRGRSANVLHLGLVMVDPNVRSQGLSWILYGLTCFVLFVRRGMRPIWISNVTQVPAVVGMVCQNFAGVYPSPDHTARTFEHVLLARQIMASNRHVFGVGADAGFDEQRFVITNAYTGGSDDLKKTYDQAAKHRDEMYNLLAQRELDYQRGDDFLQIGQVNMAAAKAYAADVVPKESLPGLLIGGAFLALQALILPMLHWFDASAQWGTLRPWKTKEPA